MELLAFVIAAYFLLYTFAASITPVHLYSTEKQRPLRLDTPRVKGSLDSWLAKEEKTALDNLLANVAPGGRNVPDAIAGSVIASPSKQHPNYYYQCKQSRSCLTNTSC